MFSVLGMLAFGIPNAEASHSWGNYHWARTANPFTVKLGDNVSGVWDSILATASTDWNASTVLDTSIETGQGGKNCSATLGRVEVCSRKYGNNGWLGIAQIWISGDHITKGVTKMNDTYFNTAKYNNPNEKLHVMCQELGHTFGLGHTSEDGSSQNTCMDYFSNTGANAGNTMSTEPNAHDYEQLETIYAHLDTLSTSFSKVDGAVGNTVDLDNPSAWGKLVSESKNKRHSVYERDFGNGNKVLTSVTWAE